MNKLYPDTKTLNLGIDLINVLTCCNNNEDKNQESPGPLIATF